MTACPLIRIKSKTTTKRRRGGDSNPRPPTGARISQHYTTIGLRIGNWLEQQVKIVKHSSREKYPAGGRSRGRWRRHSRPPPAGETVGGARGTPGGSIFALSTGEGAPLAALNCGGVPATLHRPPGSTGQRAPGAPPCGNCCAARLPTADRKSVV